MTIAASHRDLGSAPRRQHTAFDPFQLSHWDNAGLTIIAEAGLDTFVDFRSQRSAVGLARLVDEGAQFGLIYLDGSHLFEHVLVDAYFAFLLLAEDGLVLFDDCVIDHVAAVLSFVRANWSGWTEEVDLSAYHPDGASLRYWIGKRLGKQQLRAFRRTGVDARDWNVPLRRF